MHIFYFYQNGVALKVYIMFFKNVAMTIFQSSIALLININSK